MSDTNVKKLFIKKGQYRGERALKDPYYSSVLTAEELYELEFHSEQHLGDFIEVVPSADYEKLERENAELKSGYELYKNELSIALVKNDALRVERDALSAERDRYKAEVANIKRNAQNISRLCSGYEDAGKKLKQERNRYREALEFYGDPKTYETWTNMSIPGHPEMTDIEVDNGKKARQALAPREGGV